MLFTWFMILFLCRLGYDSWNEVVTQCLCIEFMNGHIAILYYLLLLDIFQVQ